MSNLNIFYLPILEVLEASLDIFNITIHNTFQHESNNEQMIYFSYSSLSTQMVIK